MSRDITRRDFLDGVALALGATAGSSLPSLGMAEEWSAAQGRAPSGYYPPALTGMRGSHPGAFEAAHELRDGTFRNPAGPVAQTDGLYDLIVVGAGIGGLAAAYFHRKFAGPSARILILDNHDDFGGHARRNEFRPAGRLLLTNGGTLAIDSPFAYSNEARGLFLELGVEAATLENEYGPDPDPDLGSGWFFDRETFGRDTLAKPMPASGSGSPQQWRRFLATVPLSARAREDALRIETQAVDYLPGLSQAQKKERLSRTSYRDFLIGIAGAHPDLLPFYQTRTHALYGLGIDAIPALDCWAIGYPGFAGLGLDRVPSPGLTFTGLGAVTPKEDHYFHFPDGNASIARLLVRSLVPGCAAGHSAEDIVTALFDYGRLDLPDAAVRIRLNSTAVSVKHAGDAAAGGEVDVSYLRDGAVSRVRGKRVVLACWNSVIPHLCPELPAQQREALRYGVKVPLVYTAVALRTGRAFRELELNEVECPGMYHTSIYLDPRVSIGDYQLPESLDGPVVVGMLRTPCQPGLPARDQQRAGRVDLLNTPFSTFESRIRDQLQRVLGAGGFDAARDIDAITVNRWPHGYAYEYSPLWDPQWPQGQRPCDIARQRFGSIAIANSDAAAAAYTDQAIDQSYRAVRELLGAQA